MRPNLLETRKLHTVCVCLSMWLCVSPCVRVWAHVCPCVHVCTRVSMCLHMCPCGYLCVCSCVSVCLCVHVYLCVSMCLCVQVCVHLALVYACSPLWGGGGATYTDGENRLLVPNPPIRPSSGAEGCAKAGALRWLTAVYQRLVYSCVAL